MWELQRKCIFIEKKLQKDLVESEKCSTFALAFENDAWLIRLTNPTGRLGEWLKPAVC